MSTRTTQCGQHDAVAAWAAGSAPPESVPELEQHLERCESCRAVFRQVTGERFPRFRNYTVIAELGRGGFGVVYKAVHHAKERTEALKVLFSKTPLREAYFQNEVHLVARLRHPNIATLYEAHLGTVPHYYTMEYVPGQHLDEYLRTHEASLEERIEIIRKVALAIDYAHRAGVIHRDLKPQNIVIDAAGEPRIVDFGIAKRLGLDGDPAQAAGRAEGALGTYGYMSPEQLRGAPVDGRTDVFSLGALLFHAITGQPASDAANHARLLAMLRERRVSRAEDLAAIIRRAVQPIADERYPDAAALVADLDAYRAGRPVGARPGLPPGQRVARLTALLLRNHPGALQVTVLAGAVLILVATLWNARAAVTFPTAGGNGVVLVGVLPSTERAIREGALGADLPGLRPHDRKSWRVLYGHFMAQLAGSGARAIVWDYYFPDDRGEYDAAFAAGARTAGVPVIVGAADMDDNAEPALAPRIRAAVFGWGLLLGVNPAGRAHEVSLPLAVLRGRNAPVPTLATVALAAVRQPEHRMDVRVGRDALELCYERAEVRPGEKRWLDTADVVPFFEEDQPTVATPPLKPGDRVYLARYALDDMAAWRARTIPFEDLLTMDAAARRACLAGKVVVIGRMVPGQDSWPLADGSDMFGCQAFAHAIDALLATGRIERYPRHWLFTQVLLWGLIAFAGVRWVGWPTRWPLWPGLAAGAGGLLGGIVLAALTAFQVRTLGGLVGGVAASTLLAVGGPVLVIAVLNRRQQRLTPSPAWSPESRTVSTTLVVTTSDSHPTPAAPERHSGRGA